MPRKALATKSPIQIDVFNGKPATRAFDEADRLEITNIGPGYENGIARVSSQLVRRLDGIVSLTAVNQRLSLFDQFSDKWHHEE